MRLLEHQSKALLSKFGLDFTPCLICSMPDDVERAANSLATSAMVVKAQVPFGGRGKAGAVAFVESARGARAAAEKLFGTKLRDFEIRSVSVEPRVQVSREFYAGIAWDCGSKLPVAL